MIVIYRLCGIPSTNPSPIFQEDKFQLNKLCLRSFLRAFKNVDIKVVYLLDHCDARYKQYLESIDSRAQEIIETNIGINETMLKAYDIAYKQDEDILFQECDYFYLPDTGRALIVALEELNLVSPYDNLNFYLDKTLHSNQVVLRLVDGHHWRTTERNTMTFAIKNDVFKKYHGTFCYYGYLDGEIWYDMLAKGYPLWTPLPSLATHMVKDYMAPGIPWMQTIEGEIGGC